MRLINADEYPCSKCETKSCFKNCNRFSKWLYTAVDAVPVVHGRWGEYETYPVAYSLSGFPCSVCGMHQDDIRGLYYCPNCGARMDGEKDNAD